MSDTKENVQAVRLVENNGGNVVRLGGFRGWMIFAILVIFLVMGGHGIDKLDDIYKESQRQTVLLQMIVDHQNK